MWPTGTGRGGGVAGGVLPWRQLEQGRWLSVGRVWPLRLLFLHHSHCSVPSFLPPWGLQPPVPRHSGWLSDVWEARLWVQSAAGWTASDQAGSAMAPHPQSALLQPWTCSAWPLLLPLTLERQHQGESPAREALNS